MKLFPVSSDRFESFDPRSARHDTVEFRQAGKALVLNPGKGEVIATK